MRIFVLLLIVVTVASGCATAQHGATAPPRDWRESESGMLVNHVQLTTRAQFVKAGESYFSPDDARVIFQAVPVPPEGQPQDEFYSMYVGDVQRTGSGRITGLQNVRRISPEGSANTCGWFHPLDPNEVIFASTIKPPVQKETPGYQRKTGKYAWMFPPEMDIVRARLDGDDTLTSIVGNPDAYLAEGSISPDGRHLLYCSLESGQGDLMVHDLQSGATRRIVQAEGYDGGPFFSPDGQRICYRSDRHGDDLLQIFVADLTFDASGAITGVDREYQLTDDANVNWCPFWHPNSRFLVFGTSRVGHHNYEVFFADADDGRQAGSPGPVRYGTRVLRVTHAGGADVLPAFSHDGKTMIWTSKRGDAQTSQLWIADFVFDADARPSHAASGNAHH